MFEAIPFILLISIAGFLIYLANKDGKSESVESCSEKSENALGKKLNTLKDEIGCGSMCVFKNFEIIFHYYPLHFEVLDTISGDTGILNTFGDIYADSPSLNKILGAYYSGDSSEERLDAFVADLTSAGKVVKRWEKQLKENLELYAKYPDWVEIGDCEYFTNSSFGVYRFSDWKYLGARVALKAIEGLHIKPCEDPKKTHWKHFLELEMKAKKQREIDCKQFVESILNKQKEYNDLQFKYEMLPSAPITDFESFTNFCKTVHTDVSFEDYEISNMLLLMKSNLSN